MRSYAAVLIFLLIGAPASLTAQFTSEIPGVPRAGVPWYGHAQGRVGFDLAGFRLEQEGGTTWAGRAGIDWGRSYRVGANAEVGFDLAMANGLYTKYEAAEDSLTGQIPDPVTAAEAAVGYGLTIGAKLRPVSYVSAEGHGVEAAVALSYRLGYQPALVYELADDSVRTGGLFIPADEEEEALGSGMTSGLAGGVILSYRSARLLADAAFMFENAAGHSDSTRLGEYEGVQPRIGALYRVSDGLAAGVSWWASGSPPWRNRMLYREGGEETSTFAWVLSFGGKPEAGTDLIVASPTGDFMESVSLFFRFRSSF